MACGESVCACVRACVCLPSGRECVCVCVCARARFPSTARRGGSYRECVCPGAGVQGKSGFEAQLPLKEQFAS